jgi:hypothetical protein
LHLFTDLVQAVIPCQQLTTNTRERREERLPETVCGAMADPQSDAGAAITENNPPQLRKDSDAQSQKQSLSSISTDVPIVRRLKPLPENLKLKARWSVAPLSGGTNVNDP